MSEAAGNEGDGERKGRRSKLLPIAAILALLGGGGAFFAVYSGALVLPFPAGKDAGVAGGGEADGKDGEGSTSAEPGAFVALEPLVVSLGPAARAEHLKVTLVLEVSPGAEGSVEAVRPRILDVLNVFLRAVDEREFELPRAMERLRAQMLRRVVLVTPPGTVRDLLVQEFVLR